MNKSGHKDMGGTEPLDKGRIRFKDRVYGAEEMAQCIKLLIYKHEDPSLNPSTHVKSLAWLPMRQSVSAGPQTCSNSSYFPDLRRPGGLERDDQVAHNTFSDLNLVT